MGKKIGLLIMAISILIFTSEFSFNTNSWIISALTNLSHKLVFGTLLIIFSCLILFWDVISNQFKVIMRVKAKFVRFCSIIALFLGLLLLIISFLDYYRFWFQTGYLIFIIAYLIIVYNQEKKVGSSVNIEINIDNPLINIDDDCLNRTKLARRIFEHIKSLDNNETINIGIFGDWGSGKTSLMNFINMYCKNEENYPTVFYRPWQYNNTKEAWNGFVSSIELGINTWLGIKTNSFSKTKLVKSIVQLLRKFVSTKGQIAELFDNLVLARTEATLDITKEKVEKELEQYLLVNGTKKKLIVFIDDIDRAEYNVVSELLMFLNEVINIKGIIYVIGLDKEQVENILQKHQYKKGKEFIDKIITLAFNLPSPTVEDKAKFLNKTLENLNSVLYYNRLYNVIDCIPDNPRKFKKFLFYLDNKIKAEIGSNFSENDFKWEVIYLSQIIEYFYPEIYKTIFTNNDLIDDLLTGVFTEILRNENGDESKSLIKVTDIIVSICNDNNINKSSQNNILEIYKRIRTFSSTLISAEDELYPISKDSLISQINIFNYANSILNYKKNDNILKDLIEKSPSDVSSKLKELFETSMLSKEEKQDLLKFIMLYRNKLFSIAISKIYEKDILISLDKVNKVIDICLQIAQIDCIFDSNDCVFDIDIFKAWFDSIKSYYHFNKPDYYATLREKEKQLMLTLAEKINDVIGIYNYLEINIHSTFLDEDKYILQLIVEIKELKKDKLIKYLISLFSKQNGINNLWGSNKHRIEKMYIFENNLLFHTESVYKKLIKLIKENGDSSIVRDNFTNFFEMLNYYLTDGRGQLDFNKTLELYSKQYDVFLKHVWNYLISERVNRRFAGSIENKKQKIQSYLAGKEILTPPDWWSELIDKSE